MKKFLAALLLLGYLHTEAQTISLSNAAEEQTMNQVAGDALYLLRQDYYIVDTTIREHKKLGLNKQPYFGRFYFLAILSGGKFYTDPNVQTPWKLHDEFQLINTEKKYLPALSTLAYSKLSDSGGFKAIDSTVTVDTTRLALFNRLLDYGVLTSNTRQPGIKMVSVGEKISDTTAWFWTAKALNANLQKGAITLDSSCRIGFEVSKGKFSPSKNTYSNHGFFSDKTIGGFIFLTKASFGRVDFLLHGLITKKPDGKIQFTPIEQGSATGKGIEAQAPPAKKALVVEEITSPENQPNKKSSRRTKKG